jgi:hypothetical protein
MEKGELIITTAKDIFLKICTGSYPLHVLLDGTHLTQIDQAFKAITKTITDSCKIADGK